MNVVYLSLGSNEGDRTSWLEKALELTAASCCNIAKRSAVYETAAWGITDQPDFLNMAIGIETMKTPAELLTAILNVETTLGRHRTVKWGPRIIDIDILLYGAVTMDSPDLIIPHPFMQDRRFILIPLAEIAPDVVHPKLHKTIRQLLAECPDTLDVHSYKG